ncbi:MAG: hypothetical protein IPO90_07500 [Flavobacteriales bacterium]|nr:hypothetical protein [Flavobacteriales bacterium]
MRTATLWILLSLAMTASAQPGALDPTYGDNGAVILQPGAYLDLNNQVIAAPDTTSYAVGIATPDSIPKLVVTRLLADGSLDSTFGEGGYAFIGAGSNTQGSTLVRTPDGSLIAAGVTLVGLQRDLFLCKLSAEGELDPTFGDAGTLILAVGPSFDAPRKMLLMPDGRFVIAGESKDANNVYNGMLLRFNPDGSWDTSFSNDGKLFLTQFAQADRFVDAAFTPDGGVVAVGEAVVGAPTVVLLAKATADGEWDTGFGQGGWDTLMIDQFFLDYAGGVTVVDDRIIICGTTWGLDGADAFMARCEADGSLDLTFGNNGVLRIDHDEEDEFYDITIAQDGAIMACGISGPMDLSDAYDLLFFRSDADGQPDAGFGTDGVSVIQLTDTTDKVFSMALQPDGGILACGYTVGEDFDLLVVRLIGGSCDVQSSVSPGSLVLCPGGTGLLSASTGDAYQWFRNGELIPGANGPTLEVGADADAGAWFSVQVSDGPCSALSDSVLVDGYVFLLPYIINEGDQPNGTGDDGEQIYCDGDNPQLVIGSPYDTNIQWFNFGSPISGANDTVLAPTSSGSYSVEGAPAVCPDFVLNAGVSVTMDFHPIVQPVVVESGILLCPDNEGVSAQWFYNGQPFFGGIGQCCIPIFAGEYTVFVDYGDSCSVLSQPFVLVGIREHDGTRFQAAPLPTSDRVTITWTTGKPIPNWRLLDITGRQVLSGPQTNSPLELDLGKLEVGRYWFLPSGIRAVPMEVVR